MDARPLGRVKGRGRHAVRTRPTFAPRSRFVGALRRRQGMLPPIVSDTAHLLKAR